MMGGAFALSQPPGLFIDNCLAAGLYIAATAYGGDARALVPALWFFDLQPPDFGPRQGDLLVDICAPELFAALARHCGLKARWEQHSAEDLGPAIQTELAAGRPIGVLIDTGQCHWSPKFCKDVSEHMLVIDRQVAAGRFRVVDTISDRPEEIGLDRLLETFRTNSRIAGRCVVLAEGGATEPWQGSQSIYGNGAFEARRAEMGAAMLRFAEALRDADPAFERGAFHSETAVPLYYRTAFLSNGREALARTLDSIGDSFAPLAEEVAALGRAWTVIRAEIMVTSERSKGDYRRVADRIAGMAKRETDAIALLSALMDWR